MMSALGGGRGTSKANKSTNKLRECDNENGERVLKSINFADVICTCPLRHQSLVLANRWFEKSF